MVDIDKSSGYLCIIMNILIYSNIQYTVIIVMQVCALLCFVLVDFKCILQGYFRIEWASSAKKIGKYYTIGNIITEQQCKNASIYGIYSISWFHWPVCCRISIVHIRQPEDHLIFTMEIPILDICFANSHFQNFYIEALPCCSFPCFV